MAEIVLDTERGVICWGEETCPLRFQTDYPEYWIEREEEVCDCCDGSEDDEESEKEAEDDARDGENEHGEGGNEDEHVVDVYWESREWGGLWRIPDFFQVLKDRFIKLHWVPSSHWQVNDTEDSEPPRNKGKIAMVQGIIREHGWPDDLDRYDRDTCLNAIRRGLKENYPDGVDYRDRWNGSKQAKTP